ncbi:MAG: right-handed parallel beta-helix repeat-containing protein [Bacteroidetes bacterium]|nr:right-handed parallel beta-helix repeat-containing protein [Bacteroidota bacterium]
MSSVNDEENDDFFLKEQPTELKSPMVNVKTYGAVGDGVTNDTKAFQDLIDSLAVNGGGTVYVPRGNYAIDAQVSIQLKSGVNIYMKDTLTMLSAIPNNLKEYKIISITDADNVKVVGGKIQGERNQHTVVDPGHPGEWGMGIGIYGSTHVQITDLIVADCWGDGIYINSNGESGGPSKFILINHVISRNNRRQGMSILKSIYVHVKNSQFIYTNGTAPQAGIDIEPNTDTAKKVAIINSEFAYNAGGGIKTWIVKSVPTVITDVRIQNNNIHHNGNYGINLSGGNKINATNNTIMYNTYPKIYAVDTTNCVLEPNYY